MDDALVKHDRVLPIHEIRSVHPELISTANQGHVDGIAASMSKSGWSGQPLFVTAPEPPSTLHQAWMGMHRLLAAKKVGLAEIPVVIATMEQLRDEAQFTEPELRNQAPWRFRSKLEGLQDPRPHRLMQLETVNQANRGW